MLLTPEEFLQELKKLVERIDTKLPTSYYNLEQEFNRQVFMHYYRGSDFNFTNAGRMMNLNRTTLSEKFRKLGLEGFIRKRGDILSQVEV